MKFILSCWDVLLATQEPLKFKNLCLKMVTTNGNFCWYLQYRRARRGVREGGVAYTYLHMKFFGGSYGILVKWLLGGNQHQPEVPAPKTSPKPSAQARRQARPFHDAIPEHLGLQLGSRERSCDPDIMLGLTKVEKAPCSKVLSAWLAVGLGFWVFWSLGPAMGAWTPVDLARCYVTCMVLVQDGSGWFRVVQDGSGWSRMVQGGPGWFRVVWVNALSFCRYGGTAFRCCLSTAPGFDSRGRRRLDQPAMTWEHEQPFLDSFSTELVPGLFMEP